METRAGNENLLARIIQALSEILDPETCQNVLEMRLIRDLQVSQDGSVEMVFRPSSRICPLAFALGAEIKAAVGRVEGVGKVKIRVENFDRAQELDQLLGESQD
jgi:metal-sulfur cluster biosynthetic enzyme